MAGKMKECRHCGHEIAAKAKICPNCGGKNKKPLYRRFWFIALILVVGVFTIAGIGGKDDSRKASSGTPAASAETGSAEETQEIEYTVCTAHDLIAALDKNALKASDQYKDTYVELSGHLEGIDSDGKYISLGSDDEEDWFNFTNIQAYVKSDEQKDTIMEMATDDPITIRAHITSVGEVLGYSMDIIEIVQ